jgi:hypothetical protein
MDIYSWFKDLGHSAFINALLALFSFFAAIVAIIISTRTQKRLKQIEEQRERDRLYDRKKARLKAVGIKEIHQDKGCSVYFQVENISDFADAREIEIVLDNININEHPDVYKRQQLEHLGPNSSVRFLLPEKYADVGFSDIIIKWKDDSDEPGYYKTTISFL